MAFMASINTSLVVLAFTLAISFKAFAQPAASPPTRSSRPPVAKFINVLIVPLDEINESVLRDNTGRAGVGDPATALPATGLPEAAPTFRQPGRAQLASAALRRALLRAGFSDVLNAAPDSPVIQRVTNDRRLSSSVISALQSSVNQVVALSLAGAPASSTPVLSTPVSATATSSTRADATSASSQPDALTDQIRAATQAAARVGQALNYRGVVVLAVVPRTAGAASSSAATSRVTTYTMLVVDAVRERGQTLTFDQAGADNLALHEAAATTGSARLAAILNAWTPVAAGERTQLAGSYLAAARAAANSGDVNAARNAINQALAIDPSRNEANVLLGDILQESDPAGAAAAYRRALEGSGSGAQSGQTWAKIAAAYSRSGDWPRTLDAGRRALNLGYDSGALRLALATAQFGRAELFRNANRYESAESAEEDANQHLDRARELAPDDPDVARLAAAQLLSQRRFREVLRTLDRFVTRYPNDLLLQTQYAIALTEERRYENAFAAWSRVWKMNGTQNVPLTAARYRRLAEGYDVYASELAKQAAQLASGVLTGSLPREAALLQLNRVNDDMQRAEEAVKIMQPPAGPSSDAAHASRVLGADLLQQAVEAYRVYVETGDELYRSRAAELHRQAINFLNSARAATY
jgi:tetratricopeptide (TPR) repeat protein